MKGIILAGGSGTRLYPLTIATSKQLLPIYDKPMIYYPMSILMLAGIRDILIISTPLDISRFEKLFGDGSKYGIRLKYAIQEKPNGLPQALVIGSRFIGKDDFCLILGDNIFYGTGLRQGLRKGITNAQKGISTIFSYHVPDPTRFGVLEFDEAEHKILSIEEKPEHPKSGYAVTGLYFFDNSALKHLPKLKVGRNNEYQMVDLHRMLIEEGKLDYVCFDRGFTWLDTGTHESLAEATGFVKMVEEHQGLKISCIEEIAFRNKWINLEELEAHANNLGNNEYGRYLMSIVDNYKKKGMKE